MRKRFVYLLLLSVFFVNAGAQKQWSNWVGQPFGISYRNGYPDNFATNINSSGVSLPFFSDYYYNGARAVAYSDSVTGQLKFVATFNTVYSRNYDTVVNGYGLFGCGNGEKYDVQIVPFPTGENKFYILHNFTGATSSPIAGLQTRCGVYAYATGAGPGLRYSVVDMDKNNGLGAVTSKNNLFPGGGDKLAIIRHTNGKDVWVVGQGGNSSTFTVTLIDQTGIKPASYYTIDFTTDPVAASWSQGGFIEASPDGSTIAITSANNKLVNLYHFNKSTGTISNHQVLTLPANALYLCFSPDGSKLYISTLEYSNCNSVSKLFQVDFSQSSLQGSLYQVYKDGYGSSLEMQRASDKKIYAVGYRIYSQTGGNDEQIYYSVNNPNQPKAACMLNDFSFIGPYNAVYLPNLINDHDSQAQETQATDLNFIKDTAVCLGSYTISAPAGYAQYKWNTGATTQSISVTQPGLYSVVAGSGTFNKPQAFGYTNVRARAQSIHLNDTTICPRVGAVLTIPSGLSNILWQNGDTSHMHSVGANGGKQSFSATDVNGCRFWDSLCVNVKGYPSAYFGADTYLCTGQSLQLYLQPSSTYTTDPVSYQWQDGSSKDNFVVTKPGTYWGKVSYQGCTVADTITVFSKPGIAISLGNDTTLCYGKTLLLKAYDPSLVYYSWQDGSHASTYTVQGAGLYWVTVQSANGCSFSDSIIVQTQSEPVFSLGSDQLVCAGQPVTLSAYGYGSFLWNTNSTSTFITVNQPGLYWLEINNNGCKKRDSVVVSYKPMPVVDLGSDTTLCEGQVRTLNAFNAGANYQWQDGSNNSKYNVSQPGKYFVKVNLDGCEAKDTIQINYHYIPRFTLGNDTTICPGNIIQLHPGSFYGTYTWQDGSQSQNYSVTHAGNYSLMISNECGSTKDNIIIGEGLCRLVMPTAFTPNGDGLNDVFKVRYPQFLKTFEMTIYNRRGETLYKTTDASTGWDGRYKNILQPAGVYIWRIIYSDVDGHSDTAWGTVMLIR